MTFSAAEIAARSGGEIFGNPQRKISTVAPLRTAGKNDLTFLADKKFEKYLADSSASIVLISEKFKGDLLLSKKPDCTFIQVRNAYEVFLHYVRELINPVTPFYDGIHPTAVIEPGASIGNNVHIGPLAVVSAGTKIGNGTRIGSNVFIGKLAEIGEECQIHPNASIYHQCIIGNRCIIHSGVVVGADGFGFIRNDQGIYNKIPQVGIVRIGNDVEIGANTTIDRASLGETVIGNGVKLDNLVQIAHNCVIEDNVVIAGMSGLAGSVTIGKGSILAGAVSIADHVDIAPGTVILGKSGVPKSITEPGKVFFGYPARDHMKALRIEAVVNNLPELAKRLEELEKEFGAQKTGRDEFEKREMKSQ